MNFYTLTSKLYDFLDSTYFRNKEKDPRNAINKLIKGENLKILDMCCGTLSNSIPIALTHKDATITGIEISPQMLKIANKKVKSNNIENIDLKCEDATNTQISGEYFDYIIIGLVLHEMKADLQKEILKESRRLLKKNGRLIVLEWEKPKNMLNKILFFPLLIVEQLLNRSFMSFYLSDKNTFFKENGFEICQIKHCSYSCVFELKKVN